MAAKMKAAACSHPSGNITFTIIPTHANTTGCFVIAMQLKTQPIASRQRLWPVMTSILVPTSSATYAVSCLLYAA